MQFVYIKLQILAMLLQEVAKERTRVVKKISTGLTKKPCSDCFLGKEENRKMAKELKEAKEEVKARDDWFPMVEDKEQEIKGLKETVEKLEKENKDLKTKMKNKKEIVVIEEEDEEDDVEDRCSFCKFVGTSKKVVRGHMKFAHLQCTDCDVRFHSMELMDSHLEEKHDVGYYTCSACGSSVDTLKALDEHIRGSTPSFRDIKPTKPGRRKIAL